MSDFDLRALVDALRVGGVDFVVIGGVAVAAHGYVRATRVLDIVPHPQRESQNMTLDTSLGALDVVQRATGVPSFATLVADAVDADLLGVPVRISSLEHLRSMKAGTGRAQDRADLENLPDLPS